MCLESLFANIKDQFLSGVIAEIVGKVYVIIDIKRLKKKVKERFSKYANQIEVIFDGLDLKKDFKEQKNEFFKHLRENMEIQCKKCEMDENVYCRIIEYTLDEVNSILKSKRYREWYRCANLQQQMERERKLLRENHEELHNEVVQLRRDMSNVNQPQEIILPGNTSIDPGVERFRENDWSGRKQD